MVQAAPLAPENEEKVDPGKSAPKPMKTRPKLSKADHQIPHHNPVIIGNQACRTTREKAKVDSKKKNPQPKGAKKIGVNLTDIRHFFERTAPSPANGSNNKQPQIFNFCSNATPSHSLVRAQLNTRLTNNRGDMSIVARPYTAKSYSDTGLRGHLVTGNMKI